MTQRTIDDDIERIHDKVASLSERVIEALAGAARAITVGDRELADRVVTEDEHVNRLRGDIESECLANMATRAPTGADGRALVGILEIATELERMGDYARDVAAATRGRLEWHPAFPRAIPDLAAIDGVMLERAMVAFLQGDADAALLAAGERTKVGRLAGSLHFELLRTPPRWGIGEALELLSVVHDLVRFADRVVNVCERTVQMVYGEFVELNHREMIAPLEAG